MQVISISEFRLNNIKKQLNRVHFFSELADSDENEYKLFLENSVIINLEPGETLMDKGDNGHFFYVLLEGQLDVFGNVESENHAINCCSGPQIFGALCSITNGTRTATLCSSRNTCSQVLAIDFNVFGENEDFTNISLNTKLKFYRHVVSNIRFKLELYKNKTANLSLEQQLNLYRPYKKHMSQIDELYSLVYQANGLGRLLNNWNGWITPDIELPSLREETGGITGLVGNLRNVLNRKIL